MWGLLLVALPPPGGVSACLFKPNSAPRGKNKTTGLLVQALKVLPDFFFFFLSCPLAQRHNGCGEFRY